MMTTGTGMQGQEESELTRYLDGCRTVTSTTTIVMMYIIATENASKCPPLIGVIIYRNDPHDAGHRTRKYNGITDRLARLTSSWAPERSPWHYTPHVVPVRKRF